MNYMAIPGIGFKLVTPEIILNEVSNRFGYKTEQVLTKNKDQHRDFVAIRQVTMTIMKKTSNLSLSAIGNYFFDKDHVTVLHSIKTVENLRETDKQFKAQTDYLYSRFGLL